MGRLNFSLAVMILRAIALCGILMHILCLAWASTEPSYLACDARGLSSPHLARARCPINTESKIRGQFCDMSANTRDAACQQYGQASASCQAAAGDHHTHCEDNQWRVWRSNEKPSTLDLQLGDQAGTEKGDAYKGCYKDLQGGKRDLPVHKGSGKSKAQCKAACSGYKYFGRQWTKQCWCGNAYGSQGKATGCKCEANNIGGDKNCVFETAASSSVSDAFGASITAPQAKRQKEKEGAKACAGGTGTACTNNCHPVMAIGENTDGTPHIPACNLKADCTEAPVAHGTSNVKINMNTGCAFCPDGYFPYHVWMKDVDTGTDHRYHDTARCKKAGEENWPMNCHNQKLIGEGATNVASAAGGGDMKGMDQTAQRTCIRNSFTDIVISVIHDGSKNADWKPNQQYKVRCAISKIFACSKKQETGQDGKTQTVQRCSSKKRVKFVSISKCGEPGSDRGNCVYTPGTPQSSLSGLPTADLKKLQAYASEMGTGAGEGSGLCSLPGGMA